MEYDSTNDTLAHIISVQGKLMAFEELLKKRASVHDVSKLHAPEKAVFDVFTPKLRGTTYGSEEYKGYLAAMKPALDHHYANNRHHPEFFPGSLGVSGMNLVDLVEMFCDWAVACERHADGDLMRSIEINKQRFNLSDQLADILVNTARFFEKNGIAENELGGVSMLFRVKRPALTRPLLLCPACHGTGYDKGEQEQCHACNGMGKVMLMEGR